MSCNVGTDLFSNSQIEVFLSAGVDGTVVCASHL